MTLERTLIERDMKYQRLKRWIMSRMDCTGKTPWMTETEWIEFSQLTANVYRKIVRDLLDDSEITRETDRDATPHVERWVTHGQ
ncbi:MAG: hypothetical protein LBQ54_00965 [Planctomycetaceae bacterium]|nr:hypothetical protein [Planctomycetaceae bacterium]